jgi:hypothetical protein
MAFDFDTGMYQNVGRYKSVNDYAEEDTRQAFGKLALILQQHQVSSLPLQDQLLQAQVGNAGLENQKKQALFQIVDRIVKGGAQPAAAPATMTGGDAIAANGGSFAGADPSLVGQPRAAVPPGAAPAQAGPLGGLGFRDVVAMKLLGGPDLSGDFKLGLEGVSRAPGSEVTDVYGNRRRVIQLEPGQVELPGGGVANAPGYVEATSAKTAAIKRAELRASNENTLAPLDRVIAGTNRPFPGTTQQLIDTVTGQNPVGQLPPAAQAAVLSGPPGATVNGRPALAAPPPDMGQLQAELDTAKLGGPEAVAQFQATHLPRILAIPDPATRQRALSGFQADLATPPGSPIHSQGQAPGAFPGFAGPAELAGSKAAAEAQATAPTKTLLAFQEPRAKAAAEYSAKLNDTVSVGQDLMQRIEEARGALAQFKPGWGSESRGNVAQIAKALGASDDLVARINGGDLAAKQEFVKLSAQSAMETLRQSLAGAGRITQQEFAVFQKNNPNIELQPDAIQKIYDFQQRLYQRTLAEQQGFDKYIAGGGDPARWQAQWARTVDPKGSGTIRTPAQQAAPAAPSGFRYVGKVQQ